MDSLSPTPIRRAALSLHAVAPADREWLLASLPPNQQGPLRALLEELRTIGMPQDAGLVDHLCAGSGDPGAEQALRGATFALNPAQAAMLATLARSEPPRIIAGLCCAAGTWRHQLLAALPLARGAEIASHEPLVNRAPALHAAILASVHRRLSEQADQAPGRLHGLWVRFKASLHAGRTQ